MTPESDERPSSILLPLALVGCLLVQMVFTVFLWRDVRALREEFGLSLSIQDTGSTVTDSACPGLEMDTDAPPLVLQDTDGDQITLTDYRGRYVLLVFSSPDCPYCVEMYDGLNVYDQEFRSDDTAILLVSRSTEEQNQALKQDEGFSFPVLTATKDVFRSFSIRGTPTLVLVDKTGKIRACDVLLQVEEIVEFVQSHK